MLDSFLRNAMPETIDKVSERLARLEVTVAQGFRDCEARDAALSEKIDVNTESLRDDIRTVLDAVGSLADELRRTADSIRNEHAADRKLVTVALQQHAKRIHDLEADR
jgi:DNA-binding ferritin-like protein